MTSGDSYPFLTAPHDEVGLNAVFLQVDVPLSTETRLHVVVPVQVVQGGFSNVNSPGRVFFWEGGGVGGSEPTFTLVKGMDPH